MSSTQRYPKMEKYISVKDIATDKFINIHNELFNDALSKYVKNTYSVELSDFLKTHLITETGFTKYCYPSKVIIKNKEYPFNAETIDLSKYWNIYVFGKKDDTAINVNPEENHGISEISYVDYMRAKVTKINRYADIEFRTSIDNEDGSTPLSDEADISDTFTNLYGKSK